MRACYFPNLSSDDRNSEVIIDGDSFHHLKNVIRIKEQDELLLLNGEGLVAKTLVSKIGKKELIVNINDLKFHEDHRKISLVLGVPKKEAFESILKIAVELNLKKIYLYYSEFSQRQVEILERHKKLLISALEQSNAAYLPEILEYQEEQLKEATWVLFSNRAFNSIDNFSKDKEIVYFVGPEGGFSESEEEELLKRADGVALPSNILRAPTAVAAGYGFITSRLV